MTAELYEFVRASFRSVWSLELLLLLYRSADRRWSRDDLVQELRSSDVVVAQSIESLLSAGLVLVHPDGQVTYAAATREQHDLVGRLADLYRRKASTVRRAIVQNNTENLQIFADAFKVRKPPS